MKKLRIYLADDHAILREGLKLMLGAIPNCEIIGEAGDGRKALEEIENLKPDMVILDISMPGLSGIDISQKIKKYYPDIKIIILSRHDNEEYIDQLLKYGINGYVLKDDAGDDLVRAVEAVRNNNTYLSPRITGKVLNEYGSRKKAESTGHFTLLTNREREILKMIAEGNNNDEIARTLWISVRTVKVHRQNIMKKLNIHRVADLVRYAIKAGLVEL